MKAASTTGADFILIPELSIDIEEVCESLRKRHERGKNFSIIVVAEGAVFKDKTLFIQEKKMDEFGHIRLGGIGHALGKLIEERTGYETRVTVLGHIQRGGSPTAFDRILGTRYGIKAYDLVKEGKFGKMAALRGNNIVEVSLEDATTKLKTVDNAFYQMATIFFG